ncbi:CHASE2 domain-containing protein [Ruegeria arenilitoris]|uniref:CHASE2 domain-containing protein n=1 Tax=Ruegeria arenilitoris TaxID=1173585 RepID=UPI00147AFECE|nr:adenylate/guanylate cyclase domain-containing protein [Ruegeria arenilitoris]
MESRVLNPVQLFLLAIVVSIVIFSGIFVIRASGALQRLEFAHFDWMIGTMASEHPSSDAVVIAIVDEDLRNWGWPLPDQKLAEIIETLTDAKVAAIGVDIYRDNAVVDGRERLKAAFNDADAVWVTKLASSGGYSIEAPDFAHEADSVGFADIPVDYDSVARRGLVLVGQESGLSLALGTKLALLALAQNELQAWSDDPSVLLFGDTPVPRLVDGFGSYRGLDDTGYQILLEFGNELPIAEMVRAKDLLNGDVPIDQLRNRVAIIGVTSESIKDDFRTPLNSSAGSLFTYGVQIHAAFVQQLLNYAAQRSIPLKSPNRVSQAVLFLITAIGGATLGVVSRSAIVALILGPGFGLAIFAGTSAIMSRDLWLPVVPMSLAWLLAFLITFMIVGWISRRQRRAIAQLFSDHLSPALADQIWKERDYIIAGGRSRPMRLQVSVLFADLAGSTTVGGSADPEKFMNWASRILNEMSRIARENGGFLEKFTGDGVLVVFGAPVPRTTKDQITDDAVAACRTALQIADSVEDFNRQTGLLADYNVRIGLNSGTVLSGTLGTKGSFQYNIMGDTVNVASRIEAFGKTLKDRHKNATRICLSEDLKELTEGLVVCEPVGKLRHDDDKSEIEIYQLIGMAKRGVSR